MPCLFSFPFDFSLALRYTGEKKGVLFMEWTLCAETLRALADHNRLQILAALRDGEKTAADLLDCVSVGQSTLSHHMKTLTEAGLCSTRKNGKWTFYRLSPSGLDRVYEALAAIAPPAPSPAPTAPAAEPAPEKPAAKPRKKDDFVPWL